VNWGVVGAIVELAAVIAIFITLFYLSVQIKQSSQALDRSNEYAQAASIHETNALFVQVFSFLIQDQEMASIYHRAMKSEDLNGVDSVRFASFLNAYFAWSEDMYCQAEAHLGFGEYTKMDSMQILEGEYGYWGRLLATDVGEFWWKDVAAHLFSPDFIKAINKIRSNAQSD